MKSHSPIGEKYHGDPAGWPIVIAGAPVLPEKKNNNTLSDRTRVSAVPGNFLWFFYSKPTGYSTRNLRTEICLRRWIPQNQKKKSLKIWGFRPINRLIRLIFEFECPGIGKKWRQLIPKRKSWLM